MQITPNKLLPFAVKILEIERAGYTTNGNQRFSIVFDDQLGWAGEAQTKSDSNVAQLIDNGEFRAGDWARLSFTRAHRINDIVKGEEPGYAKESATAQAFKTLQG
jgi:hypothetical protein